MRVVRLALIAVLTAAGVAACGDDGGSGDDGADTTQGFCATAEDIYNGGDPQPDTAAEPEDVVDVFRRLEASAPPAIAAETQMIREYIAVLLGVEEATADTPNQDTIAVAEAKVRDYLRNRCDIVLPDVTAPPPTTAAAA